MTQQYIHQEQPYASGRTMLPLRMPVGDDHVEIGVVELEIDIEGLYTDNETGQVYALLDLTPGGQNG